MGIYKVVTYPVIGNEPYVKTDTDNFEEAKESWQKAKNWNYTCVLYDCSTDRLLGSYHSSMDNACVKEVITALSGAGSSAAQAVLGGGIGAQIAANTCESIFKVMTKKMGDGNALVKAIALAMKSKKK